MSYMDYSTDPGGATMGKPVKTTFTSRWKKWKTALGSYRIIPSKSATPKASRLQLLREMADEGSSWVNNPGGPSTHKQPLKGYVAKGYVRVHSNDMTKPALATLTPLGHQVLETIR